MSVVGLVAMLVGALALAGSVVGALGPVVPPAEVKIFRAVNGLPDWLFDCRCGCPCGFGDLVVGAGAGLGGRRPAPRVAGGDRRGGQRSVLKLGAERVLRRRVARHLAVRQRPGTSQPGAQG